MSLFNSQIVDINLTGQSKRDKLIDELKKLDTEYKEYEKSTETKLPETLGLTEKELDRTTDEEIKATLDQKYEGEKNNEMATIRAEAEGEIGELDTKKSGVKTSGEEELADIKSDYASAREDAENDALKRGLMNSSIYEGAKGQLDDGEIAETKRSIKDTQDALTAIDLEIDVLNQRLQRDLEAYELKHAAKVMKELDKLVAQRDKQNEAAIAYNNTLREKENAYQKQRAEAEERAKKEREEKERFELENGYTGYKKENYLKRYELAGAYYRSMPRDRALEELRQDTFAQQYLGYYYQKLIDELTFAKG